MIMEWLSTQAHYSVDLHSLLALSFSQDPVQEDKGGVQTVLNANYRSHAHAHIHTPTDRHMNTHILYRQYATALVDS